MAFGDIKIGKNRVWNPLGVGFFDALFVSLAGAFISPYLFIAPYIFWIVIFLIRTYIAFYRTDLKLPD